VLEPGMLIAPAIALQRNTHIWMGCASALSTNQKYKLQKINSTPSLAKQKLI
jgi:hypothetical protein